MQNPALFKWGSPAESPKGESCRERPIAVPGVPPAGCTAASPPQALVPEDARAQRGRGHKPANPSPPTHVHALLNPPWLKPTPAPRQCPMQTSEPPGHLTCIAPVTKWDL
ncbi:unnamed protein product [Caretta caretta]